ncbi:MAG: hypothetical protein KGD57_06040 [Candidatus Lokiarchaeota archaeon]|nr:hypothetical protein [Candidatus Lokiarchaeota archaeon]
MPIGSIILKWNERSGTDILAKYPENIDSKVTRKTLIQIYNMHQYLIEEGVVWLNLDSLNIISYFSGVESQYYFILVLNLLENPEDFEQKAREYGQKLKPYIENEDIDEMFLKLYKEIK